ncbi:MAG: BlaI/MecI/CopY family transcriptional regulator [Planctomycetota bacterium]
MSDSKTTKLGREQLRIMQALWSRGEATAVEVTESLNADPTRDRPTAHSTVQTLLRQLERKGAVTHDRRGRTFVFRPLIAERDASEHAAMRVVDEMFQGSPAKLVSFLIEREQIDEDELEAIRRMIDAGRDA